VEGKVGTGSQGEICAAVYQKRGVGQSNQKTASPNTAARKQAEGAFGTSQKETLRGGGDRRGGLGGIERRRTEGAGEPIRNIFREKEARKTFSASGGGEDRVIKGSHLHLGALDCRKNRLWANGGCGG